MPALKAAIVRFVDESQPGWVECRFTDLAGVEHALVEKVSVVTHERVPPESRFPIPVFLECVVRSRSDESTVTVDLALPWGLQSTSGVTQFVVGASQIAPRVFVSCADIDAPEPQALVAALGEAGCVVEHSPQAPSAEPDARWSTWYAHGLQRAVSLADAIVIVVDESWDSSSWMGEEAHQALEAGAVSNAFFWNPRDLPVRSMQRYLRTRLPPDPGAAARLVSSANPRAV